MLFILGIALGAIGMNVLCTYRIQSTRSYRNTLAAQLVSLGWVRANNINKRRGT